MSEVEKNLDIALNGTNGTTGKLSAIQLLKNVLTVSSATNEYEIDTSDEEVNFICVMSYSENFGDHRKILARNLEIIEILAKSSHWNIL